MQLEISAMIARKNALQPNRISRQQALQDRARLQQERSLAIAREDMEEAAALDAKLKEMEENASMEATSTPKVEDVNDVFARINERNRQRNLEAVRKAEAEAAAKKRAERKAMANGGSGYLTPVDPSARVRTIPKLFKDRARYVSSSSSPSESIHYSLFILSRSDLVIQSNWNSEWGSYT